MNLYPPIKKGLTFIFFVLATGYIYSQSYIFAGVHTSQGVMQSGNYAQSVLSNKTISPHMGVGVHAFYQWKDYISVEVGATQFYQNLRLRDQTFEDSYDGFSVTFNNKNYFWNYYGAIRGIIPMNDYSAFYAQCSYAFNTYGTSSVTQSKDFIISQQNIDQTISTTTNFLGKNNSIIPEIGFQTLLSDYTMFSIGARMNMGQADAFNGTYTITDNATGNISSSEDFSSKGNFISLNFKLSFMLAEFSKREKKPDKIKQNLIADNSSVNEGDEVYVCHFGKNKKIPRSLLEVHLKHGDTEGKCPKKEKEKKVYVCHLGKNKKIRESLLETHLNHGDTKGKCKKKKKEKKVRICHLGKKMKVKESLVETHLAHGDTRGKCPKKKKEKKEKQKDDKEKEDEKDKVDFKTTRDGEAKSLNNRKVEKSRDIYVSSPNITIKVWDNGKEVDGDTISLNLSGRWVLQKFGLSRDKHEIKVRINTSGKNFLMLYALNLGKYPPNTAAVSVWDGEKEQRLELKSTLETCGALNIVYKP